MKLMKKFVDIGANLTDSSYKGLYFGQNHHPNDLDSVIKRAFENNLEKIIVTAGEIPETKEALEICKQYKGLYTTVGFHPTRSRDFLRNLDENLREMKRLVEENPQHVVSLGEFGLDYARLQFSSKEEQLISFEKQLDFSSNYDLPLFLHCRDAFDDFMCLFRKYKVGKKFTGVVHSFDGSSDQVNDIIKEGLYIGINGCSLRSNGALEVVKNIPLDFIMLETDAPWCEIKPSHPSFKFVKTTFDKKKKEKHDFNHQIKGRNEPINIIQVAEVVSSIKGISVEALADQVMKNALNLFKNL